jgi:TPR repeat protein
LVDLLPKIDYVIRNSAKALSVMPPEYFANEPLTMMSDIWALGCILGELSTGKRVFPGDTPESILHSILHTLPQFHNKYAAIIKKMLTKNPNVRPTVKQLKMKFCSLTNTPVPAQISGNIRGDIRTVKLQALAILNEPHSDDDLYIKALREFVKDNFNTKLVMSHLREAAPNNGDAECFLGHFYRYGISIPHNYINAVQMYRSAVQKNSVMAMTALALCLWFGIGTEKNYQESLFLFWEAAARGDGNAFNCLAIRYEVGDFVSQDRSEAARLFQCAMEKGNTDAVFHMALCYQTGNGIAQNCEKAFEYFKTTSENGNIDAMVLLATCYQNGSGVKKNEKEAVKLYREAVQKGNVTATMALALCYKNGIGVYKENAIALRLYRDAAERGSSTALYAIGNCYKNGQGIAQNYGEAFKNFQ